MIAALALASYLVQPGDTLSGIAASHGTSLAAVEAANPGITDPNLIFAGETVNLPSGGSATVTATLPQTPAPVQQSPAPVSSSPSTSSSGYSVPGMPQSLTNCIAFRESTDGTNPAAGGNVFEILPSSGYNVSGDSVAQQEHVAGELYAQYGGAPWSADGCPGT